MKLLSRIIFAVSIVTVVFLWAGALSAYIHPQTLRYAGVVGLGFPDLLMAALAALLLCVCFRPRRSWIPAVGILLCIGSIRTYFPINFPSIAPKDCMKVMTFNVRGWGGGKCYTEDKAHNLVAKYMAESQADIICVQEANAAKSFYDKFVRREVTHTPYMDSIKVTGNMLTLLSAYPIVRKQLICRHGVNASAAFWLLLDPGDTLLVVNNHLASNQMSSEERDDWKGMMKATVSNTIPNDDEARAQHASEGKMLITKIADASIARALMADTIAAFLERNAHLSQLVCGDFNDSPISYSHRLLSRNLTDAYVATANGVGRTFNEGNIRVRIDNILCSSDWRPFQCTIDDACLLSDHYPMTCYLKRKR